MIIYCCIDNTLLLPQKVYSCYICACICLRDGQESKFGLISEPMFIQREISGSSSYCWVLESFLLKMDLGSEIRTWAVCGDQTPLQCGLQC